MKSNFNWDIYQHAIKNLTQKYNIQQANLLVFQSLDSTNKKIWDITEEKYPLAVVALQQTSGKGQWGKVWQSSLGGLYLSVALECNLHIDNSFHLVMATAEGVANLLREYQLPVTIKWSNDLILQSYKLGGIKIETKAVDNVIKKAVVGIGINWCNSVPEVGINIKSYYQQNNKSNSNKPSFINQKNITSLEELTAIAIAGILNGYNNYLKLGINYTHNQYQQLLNSIGKQTQINNYQGIIQGVTKQGKLIVSLQSPGASTKVYVSPGEISLGYES